MPLPHNKGLKDNSQILRKNMTSQERHLWYDFLSGYPVHFHRQKVIGNYIVDFYCPKAKIVVELDGSQHFEPEAMKADLERTEYLNHLGIKVLRYANNEVNEQFRAVCEDIDNHVRKVVSL